jgi:hypothetical protein
MPTVVRVLFVALLLTALPIGAAVWLRGGAEPSPHTGPAPYRSVPLEDYDTTVVDVTRAGFCDRIAPDAVSAALGADAKDNTSYANGDKVELVPRETDVAHEYGCTYLGPHGTEARAWVFAPPVTVDRARQLVDEASGISGCKRQRPAPAYGDPGVALVCGYRKDDFASYRGLFGDAWLACSLGLPKRTPEQQLLDRAGKWCVAVAQAASGG